MQTLGHDDDRIKATPMRLTFDEPAIPHLEVERRSWWTLAVWMAAAVYVGIFAAGVWQVGTWIQAVLR